LNETTLLAVGRHSLGARP